MSYRRDLGVISVEDLKQGFNRGGGLMGGRSGDLPVGPVGGGGTVGGGGRTGTRIVLTSPVAAATKVVNAVAQAITKPFIGLTFTPGAPSTDVAPVVPYSGGGGGGGGGGGALPDELPEMDAGTSPVPAKRRIPIWMWIVGGYVGYRVVKRLRRK